MSNAAAVEALGLAAARGAGLSHRDIAIPTL
jgi:hypothetical protein